MAGTRGEGTLRPTDMHMQYRNRSKAVAGLESCNSTPESLRFRGQSQPITISNPRTVDLLGLASYDATSASLRLRGPLQAKQSWNLRGRRPATPPRLFSPCQIHTGRIRSVCYYLCCIAGLPARHASLSPCPASASVALSRRRLKGYFCAGGHKQMKVVSDLKQQFFKPPRSSERQQA